MAVERFHYDVCIGALRSFLPLVQATVMQDYEVRLEEEGSSWDCIRVVGKLPDPRGLIEKAAEQLRLEFLPAEGVSQELCFAWKGLVISCVYNTPHNDMVTITTGPLDYHTTPKDPLRRRKPQ
mgnify:CR=1 FL=1